MIGMRYLRFGASLLLALGISWAAANEITVAKLTTFVKSSIQMKHPDKEVAAVVRTFKLTEKLDDRTIEDLQGQGAGPKTLEALRNLRDSSTNLKVAAPPPQAVKYVPAPPPNALEQGQLIDEAREYALNYTKNLPNFICIQSTLRSANERGDFHVYDKVVARVSYDGVKEDYKIIRVNEKSVDMSMEKLRGAKSSGDFATFMKEIFQPESHAHFEWEKWGRLRGHNQYVFSYAVEKQYSQWGVVYEDRQSVMPAYHGTIWLDKDTHLISRITMEAEMPPDFPVSIARETLDYDYVKINEQEHLLPLKAEVNMKTGAISTKNELEFTNYRKFETGGTVISYGDENPTPVSADKTKEQTPPQ